MYSGKLEIDNVYTNIANVTHSFVFLIDTKVAGFPWNKNQDCVGIVIGSHNVSNGNSKHVMKYVLLKSCLDSSQLESPVFGKPDVAPVYRN